MGEDELKTKNLLHKSCPLLSIACQKNNLNSYFLLADQVIRLLHIISLSTINPWVKSCHLNRLLEVTHNCETCKNHDESNLVVKVKVNVNLLP